MYIIEKIRHIFTRIFKINRSARISNFERVQNKKIKVQNEFVQAKKKETRHFASFNE